MSEAPDDERPVATGILRHAAAWLSGFSILVTFTLALFCAINLTVDWWGPALQRSLPGSEWIEPLATAYPELDRGELDTLVRESWQVFVADPLVQVREAATSGRFVNVTTEGFRLGSDPGPWPPNDEAYNIFVFGGSTAFGYGVADKDTVPSRLQLAMPAVGGRPVRVYNLGRGGYNSTQERIAFDKWLSIGPRPDLAVFLDGLNDSFLLADTPTTTLRMTQEAEAEVANPYLRILRSLPLFRFLQERAHIDWVQTRLEAIGRDGNDVRESLQAIRDSMAGRRTAASERVVDRYLANREVIEALGRAYGVRTAFVWQPVPMPLSSYDVLRARMSSLERRNNLIWCAHIGQNEDTAANYVDSVHYSPSMADRVARCIADGLVRRGIMH